MCLAEQRPHSGKSNFIEKTIYYLKIISSKILNSPTRSGIHIFQSVSIPVPLQPPSRGRF